MDVPKYRLFVSQAREERETDRDRQRQTETDRDRQRQTETDRDRQRQTETDRDTELTIKISGKLKFVFFNKFIL